MTPKIYYLKDNFSGQFVAHMDRISTRTVNVHTAAKEFEFTNDDEANGYCKAVKVLTGQSYQPIRKRKNM